MRHIPFFARGFICIVALPLMVAARQSMAQTQPATIPTVVAQALTREFLEPPQFFNGRTPPNWPAALTLPGVKILGGGVSVLGDSTMFRMQVAVFEFSPRSNPHAVIEDVVVRAGYARRASEPPRSRPGGFAETGPATEQYCNGATLATFGPVDSVHAPGVFSVSLFDGDAGRINCIVRSTDTTTRHFVVAVPALSPPAGVSSSGGGSTGWGASSGQMTSELMTTMPTDSILAHYSAQLLASGWTSRGQPTNANGIAVQRFSFREGQDAWTGALIVVAAGDRRDVILQVTLGQ